MDGLSTVASVVAVIQLAREVGKGLHSLRQMYKEDLPGRLESLSTQITDLIVVLHEVNDLVESLDDKTSRSDSDVVENGYIHRDQSQTASNVRSILAPCSKHLSSLRAIVEDIKFPSTHPSAAKVGPVNQLKTAYSWRKHLPELNAIHQQVNSAKASFILMLGKETWDQNRDIQVQLVGMRVHLSQLVQAQSDSLEVPPSKIEQLLQELEISTRKRDDVLQDTILRVEKKMLDLASNQPAAKEPDTELINTPPSRYPTPPPPYAITRKRPSGSPRASSFQKVQSVALQVTTRSSQCGGRQCYCECHSSGRVNSSGGFLNRVVGQLFLNYSGLSPLIPACNLPSCQAAQKPEVRAEYWFPAGMFWSMIVQFNLSYQANVGPQFELRTLRRVSDSATCVNYAVRGNIEGLKGLFTKGLASPRDVSETRGYSLLRWALYANQFETVKFLTLQGADPDYRPKATTDLSPRTKANDLLLQGVSKTVENALMALSGGSDWADEQEFTTLHKIVTGLSLRDLETELQEHPEDIDKQDALGRSAISWAAARGNEEHVTLLLTYGANPNILDNSLSGPVTYSADRSHAVCTRLLLDAHARTDPVLPTGFIVGTPLNCAARNASDPAVIELLLQYGANPDATGVDRRTPLIHASRKNMPEFAHLMLQYGANINAVASDGQTPLTTAIINNSYDVLALLLHRWADYSVCPRLSGPNLLLVVAQYADARTIEILKETDHFRIKYDRTYSEGDFEAIIRSRHDADEKLLIAFDSFLGTMRLAQVAELKNKKLKRCPTGGWPEWPDIEKGFVEDDSDNSDEFYDAEAD
ncbi:ankyrin repeat-containing domain protein [Xylariaceae sp. FL1272]|nr:ankyrin repeat-containing domain protein [Xylariaceae sp. FL1272]